ncbi:MAG: hypothetical protein QNJ67_18445 [Kiloniellales bacterium]|nr:hypothetical protein [Kiloniellales bacterium]
MTGFLTMNLKRCFRAGHTFVFGVVFGLVLASAASAPWAEDGIGAAFKKEVLYALAQLAIDTEMVAASVVELQQRVDDLETLLEEQSTAKQ